MDGELTKSKLEIRTILKVIFQLNQKVSSKKFIKTVIFYQDPKGKGKKLNKVQYQKSMIGI